MWKRKKNTEKLVYLPTDKIFPNPYQARQHFSEEGLVELADSIARYGMLSPLTVRKSGDEYELVLGERRLRAAKMIPLERVPCRLSNVGARLGAEMVLIENLMREDLDLFEEAAALDRLLKTFHYTQEELAQKLGQSQSGIANKIRLLRLGREERLLITENGLSGRQARALLRVQDEALRLFALKYIIDKGYNVHQTDVFLEALLTHPEEFFVRGEKGKGKPRPVRKLVVKDVRLFINSVDKAIFHIREAGYTVEADKKEEKDYISYTIRVPKYEKT